MPDRDVVKKEMDECIRVYVEELPENDRTVLVLSEVEGLIDGDIAERMAI